MPKFRFYSQLNLFEEDVYNLHVTETVKKILQVVQVIMTTTLN